MPISINNNLSPIQAAKNRQNGASLQAPSFGAGQHADKKADQKEIIAPLQDNQNTGALGITNPNQAVNTGGNITGPNQAYIQGIGAVPSGYFLPGEGDGHASEDHIIKKTPLTGPKIAADKLAKSIFVYAPKGMQGSKNSNFYEHLSMSTIPRIIGSIGLIATSVAANKFFNPSDSKAAKIMSKNTVAGVLLYAGMKWASNKIMNAGTHAITGVDPDMPYVKFVKELPENGKEKVMTEYHKVFESIDFPRLDLLYKMGEEQGNRHYFWDKIAEKKFGIKEPLNASDQDVQPLIDKAFVKSRAAGTISSFIWAATGVALAAQESFTKFMNYHDLAKPGILQRAKDFPKSVAKTLKNSFVELWKGSTPASSKIGKGLIIASIASTVLGLINVKRGYKLDTEPSKSKIDYTKDYVEN